MNPSLKSALMLAGFLVVTFGVAALGGWVTAASAREWYPTLAKPSWTPPAWVFGPVWTLLYAMMAVAAWWVWRKAGWCGALVWYAFQLTFNAAWSLSFFGLHRVDWALADIVALWITVAVTTIAFGKVAPLAGWIFAPYLAWVSFAVALNFVLWRLNS